MATEKLQVEVTANVQEAVKGVAILEKQLERLQKIASLPNLSFRQQEKLNALLLTTQRELNKFGRAADVAAPALGKVSNAAGQSTQTLINLGRVAQDAPFGFIGIANNIDPLVQSFGALRKETGSVGGALKALAGGLKGGGGIGLALSLITSAVTFAAIGFDRWKQKTEEAKQEADKAADSIVGQYTNVLLLTTALRNSQTTLAERKDIISQLNGVSDKYFGGLNAEKLTVEQLDKAYDGYIDNLLRSFAVKQLEQDLEPLIKRLATAQVTIKKLGTTVADLGLDKIDLRAIPERERQALASSGVFQFNAAKKEEATVRKEINSLIESALTLTAMQDKTSAGINSKEKERVTLLQDQLTLRKRLSEVTASDLQALINAGIELTELQRKANELRGSNGAERPPTLGLTPLQQLNLAGDDSQAGAAIENIEEIKKKFLDVSDIINNGINSGIDQFFNALANNQDPFEALQQSVKRLVVELAAAVVKMLVLKALSAAITGGGSAAGGLLGGLSGGVKVLGKVRASDLQLLTFLRGS